MTSTSSKRGWRQRLAPHGWGRELKLAVVWATVAVLLVFGFNFLVDKAFAVEPDPVDDLRFSAELLRAPTCGDICGDRSKGAARKFRDGQIDKANGFRPDRVFKSPSAARDIFAAKFKRLIHRRWHSTSRVTQEFAFDESGAPCTADTLACGEEWYDKAVMSRCIAEHSPFPADENACTEIVAVDFDQRYTAENIRMTGNVFLCAGGLGLAVGTGGFSAYFAGAAGCWGAAWVEWESR